MLLVQLGHLTPWHRHVLLLLQLLLQLLLLLTLVHERLTLLLQLLQPRKVR